MSVKLVWAGGEVVRLVGVGTRCGRHRLVCQLLAGCVMAGDGTGEQVWPASPARSGDGKAPSPQWAAPSAAGEADIQGAEGDGGHGEEVGRPDLVGVVPHERAPGLARRPRCGTPAVPADGAVADGDAERAQLAPDALGAPEPVLLGEPADEVPRAERAARRRGAAPRRTRHHDGARHRPSPARSSCALQGSAMLGLLCRRWAPAGQDRRILATSPAAWVPALHCA